MNSPHPIPIIKLIVLKFFAWILKIDLIMINQIFSTMNSTENKEKAIDEIVKIIKDFQYNDELSDKYIREILDEDKVYD